MTQPIPPGETIREELEERGMSRGELALRIRVSLDELAALIEGRAPINLDMADRLANGFDTTEAFWINLEANYRAALAKRKAGEG